jgi:mannose-6-phosphate isomerase-like protein (cupin superfamily)
VYFERLTALAVALESLHIDVQRKEKAVKHVDLESLELMEVLSELDPARQVRVGFPHHSLTDNASTATVYFELEPGMHVGTHTDSAEELLVILEGEAEATVGDQNASARAGGIVTVPAMEPHDVRNVGEGPLRVLGFFSASTVVATFEEAVAPGGPQVFVIGAPMPIALPLSEPVPA